MVMASPVPNIIHVASHNEENMELKLLAKYGTPADVALANLTTTQEDVNLLYMPILGKFLALGDFNTMTAIGHEAQTLLANRKRLALERNTEAIVNLVNQLYKDITDIESPIGAYIQDIFDKVSAMGVDPHFVLDIDKSMVNRVAVAAKIGKTATTGEKATGATAGGPAQTYEKSTDTLVEQFSTLVIDGSDAWGKGKYAQECAGMSPKQAAEHLKGNNNGLYWLRKALIKLDQSNS
jgi:hypothetical protein